MLQATGKQPDGQPGRDGVCECDGCFWGATCHYAPPPPPPRRPLVNPNSPAAGWRRSKRGGWHNPNLHGYTGIVKPVGGGAYGWAVYGPGRSLIAGWERTKDKNAAAAYAERAALKAANRRRRR